MDVRKDDIRKLGVTGAAKTYFVTVSKELIKRLKWRRGQKVVVRQHGNKLIITNHK